MVVLMACSSEASCSACDLCECRLAPEYRDIAAMDAAGYIDSATGPFWGDSVDDIRPTTCSALCSEGGRKTVRPEWSHLRRKTGVCRMKNATPADIDWCR
jgi:hypothetical protein